MKMGRNEKTNRYLIIIHLESRDIYWARYLTRQIQEKDPSAMIVISTMDQLCDKVFKCGFKPDSILTFSLRDDISVTWLTALKLYSHAKVVIYENEGLMDFDDQAIIDKRIGNSKRSENLVDDYLYWGEKPARVFAPALLNKGFIKTLDQVSYCGYINYEMSESDIVESLSIEEKNKLFDVKKQCEGKKTILALTAFALCEYSDEEFRFDGEILSDNQEEIHAYAEKIRNKMKRYRDKYVNYIRSIANDNTDAMIILKPHPAEYVEKKCMEYYRKEFSSNNNVILIDNAILVGSLLSFAKAVIHYGSTVALEAYAHGIPTVLFMDEDYKGNSDIVKSSFICTVKEPITNLDGIKYCNIAENDLLLKESFNFVGRNEYKPSKKIMQYLCSDKKTDTLHKKELTNDIYNRVLMSKIVAKEGIHCFCRFRFLQTIHLMRVWFAVH